MKGVNWYLVELEQALNDKIKTESGIEFFIEPTFNFSWNVSVTGKVVVLPTNKECANDFIKVGDEIAFSYQVVNERKFTGESHIFKVEADLPYLKAYYNGNGESLRLQKIPDVIRKNFWMGALTNKRGKLVTGMEGTASDAERWLAQFPMSNGTQFVFANLVRINDKYYWKVKKEQIYAKRLKKRLFATGEFAICKPIDVDMSQRLALTKGIHVAPNSVMARFPDRGTLVSGGKDFGVNVGDIISFDKQYVNKYMLFGEEYFLIKESRILGIWT
jgi:hypothetical protein